MSKKVIGLDLDNTIIDYSEAIIYYSREYLNEEYCNIAEIKSALKSQNVDIDHNIQWQEFQSWLYTSGLKFAKASKGINDVFSKMASEGISFFVISHKTRRSPEYVGSFDLRKPAYLWIEDNLQQYGVRKANVFFESSRDEKIQRIISLGITHYIDDLKEVLTDSNFPSEVIKILYDPWSIDTGARNELITLKHFSELEI